MRLTMLGRLKHILVPESSAFEFERPLESWKYTNHQVCIKFQQNLFKHVVGHFVLRHINLLIIFGIRRNRLSS